MPCTAGSGRMECRRSPARQSAACARPATLFHRMFVRATVAFVLTCFDVVRSDPGRPRRRIDQRRCKDLKRDAQKSMGSPDKVHRRFVCCRANESRGAKQGQWASHAIAARLLAGTAAHIFRHIHRGHCVETEDAMALPVTPPLTGPKMIPSRADANSSRWMIETSLMHQS